MNEYQRELYELTESAGLISELLQELVDRADPQNLTYVADGCDMDGNLIYDMAYCPHCGQALDWSDDQ